MTQALDNRSTSRGRASAFVLQTTLKRPFSLRRPWTENGNPPVAGGGVAFFERVDVVSCAAAAAGKRRAETACQYRESRGLRRS